jgi:uncharacterized membrane protein YdjX (TVP38/TMEM64 family)
MTSLEPIGSARATSTAGPPSLRPAVLILALAGAAATAFLIRTGYDTRPLAVWIDSQRTYASEHVATSALLYFAVYCGFAALSLPGAWLVSVGGGALFGPWLGAPLVVLSYTSGATLAMLLSRRLLRGRVAARYPALVDKVNAGIARDGARWLLAARLTPAIPFFLVNLAVGLTRMPAIIFAAVSAVGSSPLAVLCVIAGSKLATAERASHVATTPVLVGLAGLGLAALAAGPALRWRNTWRAATNVPAQPNGAGLWRRRRGVKRS